MEFITKAFDNDGFIDTRVQHVIDCIINNNKINNGKWSDFGDEFHAYETYMIELNDAAIEKIHENYGYRIDYDELVKSKKLVKLSDNGETYSDNEDTFDFSLLRSILKHNKKVESLQ